MSAPRSTSLFHFTKSLDVLKSILKHGFYPHYSLEDIEWMKFPQLNAMAYPIVCFCDIPLSRIIDHTQSYGQFGIGLKRGWGTDNGLNPIIYVSHGSHVSDLLFQAMKTAVDAEKTSNGKKYIENSRQLMGYCKPLSGKMFVQGRPTNKEFYQESEWRFFATHDKVQTFLKEDEFGDQDILDNANNLSRQYCTLSFSLKDVKYLFVKEEDDILALVNFINDELGEYPHNDVQMLLTRIFSHDTIENDI